jgi:hypothetical protein
MAWVALVALLPSATAAFTAMVCSPDRIRYKGDSQFVSFGRLLGLGTNLATAACCVTLRMLCRAVPAGYMYITGTSASKEPKAAAA